MSYQEEIKILNPWLKKSKPLLSLCILCHYSNHVYLWVLGGIKVLGLFTSLWTSFPYLMAQGSLQPHALWLPNASKHFIIRPHSQPLIAVCFLCHALRKGQISHRGVTDDGDLLDGNEPCVCVCVTRSLSVQRGVIQHPVRYSGNFTQQPLI